MQETIQAVTKALEDAEGLEQRCLKALGYDPAEQLAHLVAAPAWDNAQIPAVEQQQQPKNAEMYREAQPAAVPIKAEAGHPGGGGERPPSPRCASSSSSSSSEESSSSMEAADGIAPTSTPQRDTKLPEAAPPVAAVRSSSSDEEDDMPLAKRKRLLQTTHPFEPSPEIIVLLDSGSEGEALGLSGEGSKLSEEAAGAAAGARDTGGAKAGQAEHHAAAQPPEIARRSDEVEEIELGSSSEGEFDEVLEEAPLPEAAEGGSKAAARLSGGVRRDDGASRSVNGNAHAAYSSAAAAAAAAAGVDLPGTTGYGFTDPAAVRQFRQAFLKPRRKSPPSTLRYACSSAAGLQRKAREILDEMTAPKPAKVAEVKKVQAAWHSAAMAWRQKNKPSEGDLSRRQAEETARISAAQAAAARSLRNPQRRAEVEAKAEAAAGGGGRVPPGRPLPARPHHHQQQQQRLPPAPPRGASESELRSYYRQVSAAKVAGAASFVQVLRSFNVPCPDPARVKDSYRLAVRMYHPDSNSRQRLWGSAETKMEAEEVMKVINERKPEDL